MKTCSKCLISKDKSFFPSDKRRLDGKFPWCKQCKKLSDKISYENNRNSKKIANRKSYLKNKEQRRAAARAKRQDPDFLVKEKERSKKYRLNNAVELIQKKQEYYQKNKHIINEKYRQKRQIDINFRLQNNMRSRLSHALKQKTKGGKTVQYIGCSIEEFKKHIESKWQPGMTWDNYGKNGWHIDHIIPCYRFDFSKEDDIKKCFHYSNMQPLWALDNMRKNKY